MKFPLHILYFILCALCIGCGSDEDLSYLKKDADAGNVSEGVDMEGIAPIFSEYPRLNDSSAVEYLLEFGKSHPQTHVRISTKFGTMELRLYEDTPIHRANFIYLIHRGYYQPTELVRIVKNFIVQGGNSEEEGPQQQRFVIGTYSLPAEFSAMHMHKKGALAMSRSYEQNPDKRSAAYDFYFVHGRKYGPTEIFREEKSKGFSYSADQKKVYETEGGAIHLDGEHTVFGEITSGFEVLDKLADVAVDGTDWPKERLEIIMEIID